MKPKNVHIVSMSFLDLLSCALGGTYAAVSRIHRVSEGPIRDTLCPRYLHRIARRNKQRGLMHEVWISGILAPSGEWLQIPPQRASHIVMDAEPGRWTVKLSTTASSGLAFAVAKAPVRPEPFAYGDDSLATLKKLGEYNAMYASVRTLCRNPNDRATKSQLCMQHLLQCCRLDATAEITQQTLAMFCHRITTQGPRVRQVHRKIMVAGILAEMYDALLTGFPEGTSVANLRDCVGESCSCKCKGNRCDSAQCGNCQE